MCLAKTPTIFLQTSPPPLSCLLPPHPSACQPAAPSPSLLSCRGCGLHAARVPPSTPAPRGAPWVLRDRTRAAFPFPRAARRRSGKSGWQPGFSVGSSRCARGINPAGHRAAGRGTSPSPTAACVCILGHPCWVRPACPRSPPSSQKWHQIWEDMRGLRVTGEQSPCTPQQGAVAVLLPQGVARSRSCLAAPNVMLMSLAGGCWCCWAACHHAWGFWAALLPCTESTHHPAGMRRGFGPPCCNARASRAVQCSLRASQPRHAALSLVSPCSPCCPGLWARDVTSSTPVAARGGSGRATVPAQSRCWMLQLALHGQDGRQLQTCSNLIPPITHLLTPSLTGLIPCWGLHPHLPSPQKACYGHAETLAPACSRLCSCTHCPGEAVGCASRFGSCTHPPAGSTAP